MPDKKRVLVVGGSTGIGFAIAKLIVRDGGAVVVASSNADKIAKAADQLGAQASGAVLDVTNEDAVGQYFESAGGFDHIVFTAGDWGGPGTASVADLDLKAVPKNLGVRFWGALSVAKYGASQLPAGGSYTVTSGVIAHAPAKGWALASAGASAIESLTRGMAIDLAPVRVNCVCPGLILTGVWDSIPEKHREAQLAKMSERSLVPRLGRPEECAEAYLYLMRNAFVTGQILQVEGGQLLGR